jgi:ribosome biogenesis GTPase A
VHKPDIPDNSLDELITALKTAHTRLLTPPEAVSSDPNRLKKWRPRVRQTVDWEDLLRTRHFTKLRHKTKRVHASGDVDEDEEEAEQALADDVELGDEHEDVNKEITDPLTIGLIGQPNVGKSSLLNALLGQQRVRASRTPGKVRWIQGPG